MDRRNRLDLNHPAELAIYNAMQEVEKMPPSVKLTEAVIKLQEARNLVADFVDDLPECKHAYKCTLDTDEWSSYTCNKCGHVKIEDFTVRVRPTDKQDKP